MANAENSDHKQDQDEEINGAEQSSDKAEARLDKPQSFSELTKLARESKSSWPETVPGRKADKQFMLAIIIAIILISGITLIGSYQEQLSIKLDQFKNEFVNQSNAPALNQSGPDRTSNELLAKFTRLETQITALQTKVTELKTAVVELESAAQPTPIISTESVTPVDLASAQPGPKPPSEPKPKLKPKPKPEPVITAPGPVEPTAKTPAPLEPLVRLPIPKEIQNPLDTTPTNVSPTNIAPRDQSPWLINIGAFSDPTSAAKLLKKVQGVVANAQIQDIQVKNQTLYRIRAFGYISQDEAKRDAERLHSRLGLSGTWISKEK
ncbi:MAG: SPOR domain-containing protein [Porticoccaceae bacterium]|nr:SPOR domain-containing protein [Porticoccaceae bacterium]